MNRLRRLLTSLLLITLLLVLSAASVSAHAGEEHENASQGLLRASSELLLVGGAVGVVGVLVWGAWRASNRGQRGAE